MMKNKPTTAFGLVGQKRPNIPGLVFTKGGISTTGIIQNPTMIGYKDGGIVVEDPPKKKKNYFQKN
jgi:hypothetical protein